MTIMICWTRHILFLDLETELAFLHQGRLKKFPSLLTYLITFCFLVIQQRLRSSA